MAIALHMRGLDFSVMPDGSGYAGIARSGVGFVCRYSAGVGGASNPKCTKAGEIADAVGHKVDFLANFELREDTPQGGAGPGRQHGAADRQFWESRGLAPGAGVTVSWEPGSDTSKFGQVAEFITSYKQAIGRPVGLYAGLRALLWMRERDLIDFTWLPMSSFASGFSWGAIPQAEYAARMLTIARDNGLNLVQNRNRWYPQGKDERGNEIYGADENIIVNLPALPWSQLQAAGHLTMPARPSGSKMWQGAPWPGPALGFGPGDHFGNVNGPAQSHGGAIAADRPYVRMIQQRLIVCGFVPGHRDPNDGWADGIFDIRGNGQLGGPTTAAVMRFQAVHRPGRLTTKPGQVWSDDWDTLFNLR
jgi:hypothetical protein